MDNDTVKPNDPPGSLQQHGSAAIPVTVLATATREQVNKACHDAAFAHFGKDGDGSIHLTGLRLESEDGINKTFILSAELHLPPNDQAHRLPPDGNGGAQNK